MPSQRQNQKYPKTSSLSLKQGTPINSGRVPFQERKRMVLSTHCTVGAQTVDSFLVFWFVFNANALCNS